MDFMDKVPGQLDIEPAHSVPVEVRRQPKWMVIHGDCMEAMRSFGPGDFDIVMTDIPYDEVNARRSHAKSIRRIKKAEATDARAFGLRSFVDECCRIASGHVYIFCGYEQLSPILRRMRRKFGMHVRPGRWRKTNPSPMNGHHRYLSDIELCAVGTHGGSAATWFGKYERAEWNHRAPNRKEKERHDAIKPPGLWGQMLGPVARPGMTVLDPCAGSMTSAEACMYAGLDWVGIERDEACIARNRPFVEVAAAQLHLT
jgi:modification methylase